jgi:CPA1 family monovalent cation:H+ antiporter
MQIQDIIGILLVITALASYINYKFIKLPKSIGITLVTMLLTIFAAMTSRLGWNLNIFAQTLVDSIGFNETFLHGMLSFLLFAGSLHVNLRELYKNKYVVLSLATVSVIISTIVIGYCTYYLTRLVNIDLPFAYCFVFGALISPTDPIAVLGVLKHVGAPKSLELKIAGESLFNDGMGIVLFFLALAIAEGQQQLLTPTEVAFYFIQQAGGGLLLGVLIGWFAAKIMHSVNDFEVELILTLALVTGGYMLSTAIDVSGPICMVAAGLIVGESFRKCAVSKETIHKVYAFWDLLDEIFNAVLFVLIGLEFMLIKYDIATSIASVAAILITLFARWISVLIPLSFMNKFRRLNPELILIMTWGGLRGGISIALALGITGEYHDMIVSITYWVVLFSMAVQGLTIGPLISKFAPEKLTMRRK